MNAVIHTRRPDAKAEQMLLSAGTPPLLARLFAARNVHSPAELRNHLDSLLPYRSLKNIGEAAARLAQAVQNREKITIVADYDVDGATACAVGILGLRRMGACVDFLVPDRFRHGYGLTPQLAEQAARLGTQLLMTVDNGISAVEGVACARELGMDTIITDHHLPADRLPEGIIVNPNQPGCGFASKHLAGVGVVFYVLTALRALLRSQQWFAAEGLPEPNLAELLDLVALGTVADVVTLDHNNRILVTQGLRRIRAGKTRPGIKALFQVAARETAQAQPFDLGYAIGPRLNAAGRLDSMEIGIRCLLSDDPSEAAELAGYLNEINRSRQEIEQSILHQATDDAARSAAEGHLGITVFQPGWHQGVIGIVAGRLKDRFYRPAIVFAAAGNGEIRGSGRSIPALHLRNAIDLAAKRHPGLILRFGGHAMAAGLSIREQDFGRFRSAFEGILAELLDPAALTRTFVTDGSLAPDELSLQTAEVLSEPVWGQGFQPPCFHNRFDVVWQKVVGNGHTKAGLGCGGQVVEAMFFRCTEELPPKIHTVYRPVANQWRNRHELQLHIEHWEAD